MTSTDMLALLPLTVLSFSPVVVMLAIAVHRRHTLCLILSLIALLVSLLFALNPAIEMPVQVTPLIVIDSFAMFYMSLTIVIAMFVIVLGLPYLAHRESQPEEYYVLLLLATAGACVMSASTHFASFYLGLEILSVSQYGLVAYVRRDPRATEAAVKYLVLAAASASFMLFGMALIYAELGTMQFELLAHATSDQMANDVVLLGLAMLLAGVSFKLSIVPFHLWTPDIYEGAPAPVAAYLSTVSKVGLLSVLIRYFVADTPVSEALTEFVAVTAAASMIVGNLLALVQKNLKRLLAFSSVAHMGYLSVVLLAGGSSAVEGVSFYLLAYAAATLGAFSVIMTLSKHPRHGRDVELIEEYRGLYRIQPFLAAVLVVSLLSLAGIPLTAGFLAKLYVVQAGAEEALWWLLAILAVTNTASLYYYLRVVLILFARSEHEEPGGRTEPLSALRMGLLLALAGFSLVLGVYPAPVLAIVRAFGPGG